jgi:hypothetical protein
MTWAVYFNGDDDAPLISSLSTARNDNRVSAADRQLARNYWTGGIQNWATAPISTDPECTNDPDCHVLVCTFGTSVECRELVRRLGTALGNDFLISLAKNWVARDPYP